MADTDWKARVQAAEAREVALRKRVQALADEFDQVPHSDWLGCDVSDAIRSALAVEHAPPAVEYVSHFTVHEDGRIEQNVPMPTTPRAAQERARELRAQLHENGKRLPNGI